MKRTLNGHELKEMFLAATKWLEKLVPDINALNVYPVPDGDCGTNMLFTMRASLAEAARADDDTVSAVAQAMAQGALMGARGNSGVILSQIWRGMAKSLRKKTIIDGKTWASALCEASRTAYQALTNPVEGTILTVVKDSANAAYRAAKATNSLALVLETAVDAARTSVEKTPKLLSVLREAGVVDAGGHGFYTLLEGALLYAKGDMDNHSPQLIASNLAVVVKPVETPNPEEDYGYCTQFLVSGENIDADRLRGELQNSGKSLMVVGDQATLRVHIHTLEPDNIVRLASAYGKLSDIDIRNMDEQHKDFLLMHKEKEVKQSLAIVAVVNGNGLANVFSDLGVSAIVPGGQTMNPSTMDLLQAVEAVPSNNVIILPNNKNIAPTAGQVQGLTKKQVKVIPTETIPQGVTALIAFSPEADFPTNVDSMTEAYTAVKTIEITKSTRTTRLDGIEIKEGQFIGLLDGKLLTAADKAKGIILRLFSGLDSTGASIVTVYYGADATAAEAAYIGKLIHRKKPQLEIEVVNGGQPYYNYIISVE